MQRLQHAHGEQVVRREHRVGALGRRPLADRLAGSIGPRSTVSDSVSITSSVIAGVPADGTSGARRDGRRPGGCSSARRRTRRGGVRSRQVAHRELTAHDVVDGDRREAADPRHSRSTSTTGVPRARSRCEPRQVIAERGDEHAVHALLLEQVEVGALAVGVLVAVAEQDGHAVLRGAILRAAGDIGEERVPHVEHDEPDRAAPARRATAEPRRCGRSRARSIAAMHPLDGGRARPSRAG